MRDPEASIQESLTEQFQKLVLDRAVVAGQANEQQAQGGWAGGGDGGRSAAYGSMMVYQSFPHHADARWKAQPHQVISHVQVECPASLSH